MPHSFVRGICMTLAWIALAQTQMLAPGTFLERFGSLPDDIGLSSKRALSAPVGKIDPRLLPLPEVVPLAGERSLSTEADIPIAITTSDAASAESVRTAVRQGGGIVAADFDNVVWARIPPGRLAAVASLQAVRKISPQDVSRGENANALPASAADGIRAAHMEALLERGYTGKGVKVGVLDLGFGGYSKMLGQRRIRAAAAMRAFPERYRVENDELHGTACLEILSNAAPGAELYLASFDGYDGDFVNAAGWLISQGVQIISYSAGKSTAPTNDTDPVSRFIDWTSRRYGVLWVVAAGNEAQKHWMGPSDVDRSGFIHAGPSSGLEITAFGNHVRLVVRWEDSGADPRQPQTDQDIDAYLLAPSADGKRLQTVAESEEPQRGGASVPLEVIDYSWQGPPGRQFVLKLKATVVNKRFPVHVFLETNGRVYPAVAAGSVLNPASARAALAVGAVDVTTDSIAAYSAQGPTDDDRLKPEVSAPSNTVSWTYADRNGRFNGTSASCPHVAAFAAVLREMYPRLTAAQLRLLVMRSVIGRGTPRPNSFYGYGEIDGENIPLARTRSADGEQAESNTLPVPDSFGGKVTVETLDRLWQRADSPSEPFLVHLATAWDVYHAGDHIRLGLESARNASCLIFLRDSAKRYELLSSSRGPVLRLAAGKPAVVPADSEWVVSGPPGTDDLLLVCLPEPADLDKVVDQEPNQVSAAAHSYEILDR